MEDRLAAMIDLAVGAVEVSKGAPLDAVETEYVLALLASWLDLLARGMSPEKVAAIVEAEVGQKSLN
jgi:hypothetical protein